MRGVIAHDLRLADRHLPSVGEDAERELASVPVVLLRVRTRHARGECEIPKLARLQLDAIRREAASHELDEIDRRLVLVPEPERHVIVADLERLAPAQRNNRSARIGDLVLREVILQRLRILAGSVEANRREGDVLRILEEFRHRKLALEAHFQRGAREEVRARVARMAPIVLPLRMRGVFAGLDAHVEFKGIIGTHLLEGFTGVGIEVKNLETKLFTKFARRGDIRTDPRRAAANMGLTLAVFGDATRMRNRCREDQRRSFPLHVRREAAHQLLVVRGSRIPVGLGLVGVVVPEGDDHEVAGLQRIDDFLPASLGLIALRAPAPDRPVMEHVGILHIPRQGLSPPLLRILTVGVVAHRRIARKIQVGEQRECARESGGGKQYFRYHARIISQHPRPHPTHKGYPA